MTNFADQFRVRGGELETAVTGRPRRTVADVLRLCRSTWIIFSRVAGKISKIALRLFAVILALLGGLSAGAAGAAEITVLCAGAMRAVLQQLAPTFEKSSGDKLVIEYATAGKLEEKVAADEAIDVAILTKPRADKLVRAAKLVGGTTAVLCWRAHRLGREERHAAPRYQLGRSRQTHTTRCQIDRLCRPSERRHQRYLPGASPRKARHRCRAEIEGSPRFAVRRSKL